MDTQRWSLIRMQDNNDTWCLPSEITAESSGNLMLGRGSEGKVHKKALCCLPLPELYTTSPTIVFLMKPGQSSIIKNGWLKNLRSGVEEWNVMFFQTKDWRWEMSLALLGVILSFTKSGGGDGLVKVMVLFLLLSKFGRNPLNGLRELRSWKYLPFTKYQRRRKYYGNSYLSIYRVYHDVVILNWIITTHYLSD